MKLLSSIFIISFLTSCLQERDQFLEIRGRTMGTSYKVKFQGGLSLKQNIEDRIERKLEALNQEMSTYIPLSDISKLNKSTPGEWSPVSKDFLSLYKFSLKVNELTEGHYDVTLGPLVNLWGFGPQKKKKFTPPTASEVSKALQAVGEKHFEVREKKSAMRRLHSRAYLDFSSLAKGLGVDWIGQVLKEHKVTNFMIEIGGEVLVSGSGPQGAWRIGIASPTQEQRPIKILRLRPSTGKQMAIATSGNYNNYRRLGEKSLGHIILPTTGYPAQRRMISATVLDENCHSADAWATAYMSLPEDKAVELATKLKHSVYFIFKNTAGKAEVFMTPQISTFFNN